MKELICRQVPLSGLIRQRASALLNPTKAEKTHFVHISAVERAGLPGLREGQKVEFELVPSRDGTETPPTILSLWTERSD